MAANGFQASAYAVDKASTGSGDVDMAADPASSSFFSADYKKHEDLKSMLDNSKDSMKLEAMKRIISMVARGRDCSDLFPAVVKNVVSKNAEVKKLVYVYLTRYAEEQQDLALLSISTFQRALKDPNQLIRGSALRVLSSIRVPMIVPIMMLAIKEAVTDMSPYVRKTAAHAIPKLYSLDPEEKDLLIEVIEKLLGDRTTLVAGSAIQAFEEVCPDRIDLIHKHYRKLCSLLVDVEEWGQVVIINMLTRYVRTQFIDPDKQDGQSKSSPHERDFYSDDEEEAGEATEDEEEEQDTEEDSDSEEDDDEDGTKEAKRKAAVAKVVKSNTKKTAKEPVTSSTGGSSGSYVMDADHRLLLRNSKPLLNSRNSAVVMAVAQLYYHCAPQNEVCLVAKALIRLLRSHKECQYVVLSNIASMSIARRHLFEAYLKSFYVHSSDPTQVKLLKLEVLTNLATETSISTILREFQTYVTSSDKEFVAATIQAIGRCASNISEITDTCLSGLVQLMSKKDETIVAESVVVIRKLLQMQSSDHKDIIVHMARLVDGITVPMARASILWLIGEYCDRVPKMAPDVLRKMAKSFISEEDIVKLQILNLAAKLCITNAKQSRPLTQYVLNLAKYDQNYDIRDRSRFLRALIFPQQHQTTAETPADANNTGYLAKHSKKIFLATKPAPLLQSKFKDRPQYQLGSLSHLLNHQAAGYHDLPAWPVVAPDPSVRKVEVPNSPPPSACFSSSDAYWPPSAGDQASKNKKDSKKKAFYSDEEETESGSEDDEEESGSEEEATSEEEEDNPEEEEEETEEDDDEGEDQSTPQQKVNNHHNSNRTSAPTAAKTGSAKARTKSATSESEVVTSEVTTSSDEDTEETSSEEEVVVPPPVVVTKNSKKPTAQSLKKSAQQSSSSKKSSAKSHPPKKDYDLLLDFDNNVDNEQNMPPPVEPSFPVMDLLTPTLAPSVPAADYSSLSSSSGAAKDSTDQVYIPSNLTQKSFELFGKFSSRGGGLNVNYRFPRSISVFNSRLVNVELEMTNRGDKPIKDIHVTTEKLQGGREMQAFEKIDLLACKSSLSVNMSFDFQDSTQPAVFELVYQQQRPQSTSGHDDNEDGEEVAQWDRHSLEASVKPPVGELLQPISMTDREFTKVQSKLTGMNDNTAELKLSPKADLRSVTNVVYSLANIVSVSAHLSPSQQPVVNDEAEPSPSIPPTTNNTSSSILRYAGRTVNEQISCLIEVAWKLPSDEDLATDDRRFLGKLRINCEKITIGSLLLKEILAALSGLP